MGVGHKEKPLTLHWRTPPALARAIEWSIGLRGHTSFGRTTRLPAGLPPDVLRRIDYLAAHGFLRVGTEWPGPEAAKEEGTAR